MKIVAEGCGDILNTGRVFHCDLQTLRSGKKKLGVWILDGTPSGVFNIVSQTDH